MKRLFALSCLFCGIIASAQSQESYTLAENTAKSSISIATKKVTYEDHLLAAQSFNLSPIESFNEIDVMEKYLLDRGVKIEDTYLDGAGLDTYSTIYRTKNIYQFDKVILITQSYHLKRALAVIETAETASKS